jgi:hypothetical protein
VKSSTFSRYSQDFPSGISQLPITGMSFLPVSRRFSSVQVRCASPEKVDSDGADFVIRVSILTEIAFLQQVFCITSRLNRTKNELGLPGDRRSNHFMGVLNRVYGPRASLNSSIFR